eukprot:TRINITY_DN58996_c0_g1_i1.p1 TRINITY_DN58996_c0_g1~~TRINITY_DN58996_c0_g1_i1.p1  ORF type:complete len:310 (-),score=34.86 TRINITY_DN58996_c0_g1_i1:88-1017(-)
MSSEPLLQRSEEIQCRVCHLEDSEEYGPLLSPCLCDGSVRWVHRGCLDGWRAQGAGLQRRATQCELCGFRYIHELRPSSQCEIANAILCRSLCAFLPVVAVTSALGTMTSWKVSVLATAVVFGLWAAADLLQLTWAKQGYMKIAVMEFQASRAVGATETRAEDTGQVRAGYAALAAAGVANSRAAHAVALGQEDDEEVLDLEMLLADGSGGRGALSVDITCCLQTVAFLLAPPLAISFFRFSLWLLSREDLYILWLLLSLLGAVYWPTAFILVMLAAGRRPPLVAVCGPNGFPLVRNLSNRERCGSAET